MSDWQPIETAPRDDRRILGYFPHHGNIERIWWNDDRYAKKPRPFWNNSHDWSRTSDARRKQPTHWMPFPEPPEDTQ